MTGEPVPPPLAGGVAAVVESGGSPVVVLGFSGTTLPSARMYTVSANTIERLLIVSAVTEVAPSGRWMSMFF